jgi:Zn-finger nucleic acid-binding protein
MSERHGVEIDYCPACRGIWLDRGELDKLLAMAPGERTSRSGTSARGDDDDDDDRRRHTPPYPYANQQPYGSGSQSQGYPPKKRESFWSNLFDFD